MSKNVYDNRDSLLFSVYETHEIVANPTLTGGEANLTGIKIGETKYQVGGGSVNHLYKLRLDVKCEDEQQNEFHWYLNIFSSQDISTNDYLNRNETLTNLLSNNVKIPDPVNLDGYIQDNFNGFEYQDNIIVGFYIGITSDMQSVLQYKIELYEQIF